MGHIMEVANCLCQAMALRLVIREAAAASPAWQAFYAGPLQQYNEVCFVPRLGSSD